MEKINISYDVLFNKNKPIHGLKTKLQKLSNTHAITVYHNDDSEQLIILNLVHRYYPMVSSVSFSKNITNVIDTKEKLDELLK